MAVVAKQLNAEQDVICSGDYYFKVKSNGKIDSYLPPSDTVCSIIDGSLTIEGYSSLYELSVPVSIKSIKTINGALYLRSLSEYPLFLNTTDTIGTLSLSKISFTQPWALNQIITIYEYISVAECDNLGLLFPNLIELQGLYVHESSITSFGIPKLQECGSISITNSPSISSLSILNNIKKVNGDLLLESLQLSSLGMDSLASITGRLYIGFIGKPFNIVFPIGIIIGDLNIYRNEFDVTIKILSGSVNILGSLWIESNSKIIDLRGLGKVKIGKSMYIAYNQDIIYMFDLSDITTLNGGITIYNNYNMEYPVFTSLQYIGDYLLVPQILQKDESLTRYFPKLKRVEGELDIEECNFLANLKGLSFLDYIGSLQVSYNFQLTSLEGMEKVKKLGALTIQYNKKLKSLKGLNNLASINGDSLIASNSGLVSLDGLNNLVSVNGSFSIRSNNKIKSIRSLSSLSKVYGNFSLYSNAITSLDGLQNLNLVGSFELNTNKMIKALYGLRSLTTINGALTITGMKTLTTTKGMDSLEYVKSIEINMAGQQNLIEIVFGKQGNNLGYPWVNVYLIRLAKVLTLDKVRQSFSSICKVINIEEADLFECNK